MPSIATGKSRRGRPDKGRRIESILSLMTILSVAPEKRMSRTALCRALDITLDELEGLVYEIETLSNREEGMRSGVSIQEDAVVYEGQGNLLAPVRLTLDESLALSCALSALDIEGELRERIEQAFFTAELVRDIRDDGALVSAARASSPWRRTLLEAASFGIRCSIRYQGQADSQPRTRLIDPERIYEEDGNAYLVAWDMERHGERRFRLDRISNVVFTDDSVERHPYRTTSIHESLAAAEKSALVRAANQDAIAILGPHVHPHDEDPLLFDVPYTTESWLLDTVIASAGELVIEEPGHLREALRAYATELYS